MNRIIKDGGRNPGIQDAVHLNHRPIPAAVVRPIPLKAGLLAFAIAAASIAAALPSARAQDAPAGSQARAPGPPPSTATPAPAGASSTAAPTSAKAPSTGAQASGTSSSSSSADTAGGQASGNKSEPVCFKLTGRCVDASKATSTKSGAAGAKTGAGGKKLNLVAPDVRTVVSEQELKEPLPNTEQITEVQESQTVSVKTNEGVPPDVPGGLGAIWWAVVHPSQAWRIVAPAE